ncbi:retrovirus-related Pol polyprotein from transposon opus [Trichonephila clavipes]|nr:retrovirus-related Pol polyprotein from transposon opus [Trichonephila clavipes]
MQTDLAEAALLSFPRSGLPLSLCTDASDFSVGVVLQQLENEGWKRIAFYSKKRNETQTRYSTYDRELLGIYLSVKHFKHLLEGNDFVIYTDHKPLTFAFKQKNEKASPRQQRQLQYISEFSCNIQHVMGKDNVVADALSRIESISEINFDAIAEEQTIDEELQQLLQDNSRKFKPSTLPSGKELWCDISTQKIRPYIPQKFRFQMFQLIHGLAHPGIKTAVKLMTEKYVCGQVIYSQFGLAIHQNDHQARRRFGEWAQNEIAVVPDFHKRILFSDEAHFWLNGYVNKQNCRIWSEANPQVYVETPLHPEKLTVWCASWAGGILLQKR